MLSIPTICLDPNTNMISANIFSKFSHCTCTHCHLLLIYCRMGTDRRHYTVDLPSDITVLPQNYTLHAIKVGKLSQGFLQAANWYYESGSISTELCSRYRYSYSCSTGNGLAVDRGNGRFDYTLTLTWSEKNITSGILQTNNNSDHVYRFYLHFGGVACKESLSYIHW